MRLILLLLVGCGGNGGDSSKTPDDSGGTTVDGPWHLLANEVPSGMMLSAHEGATGTIIVGGDLHGGPGTISHLSEDRLCVETEEQDQALWWIHGRSATDWYAVGVQGIVIHESDGVRTREDIDTTDTLFGVYDDGTDVWAVGGDVGSTLHGSIWRKPAGGDWEVVASELPGLMFKPWAGWFVGHGQAYFWDGTALVEHHPPNGARLVTARGTADDLWAVGGLANPEMYHWTGAEWETVTVDAACATDSLNGVYVDPDGNPWVAGHAGSAAKWDGSTWECADKAIASEDFHAVWWVDGEPIWLGGNLLAAAEEDNYGTLGHFGEHREIEVVEGCD